MEHLCQLSPWLNDFNHNTYPPSINADPIPNMNDLAIRVVKLADCRHASLIRGFNNILHLHLRPPLVGFHQAQA